MADKLLSVVCLQLYSECYIVVIAREKMLLMLTVDFMS